MGPELVIASLDRAGGHAGMIVMIVVLAALVYGVVQFVKRRPQRAPTDTDPERDREVRS